MEEKIYVLYVEDDKLEAEMTKLLLDQCGFSVKLACNGKVAWREYRHKVPDILLLDIYMPGKNGLELLQLVRRVNKEIPVVIYSGQMDPSVELQAIELGADDCIYKNGLPELFVAKLKCIYRRIRMAGKNPRVYILSENTRFNAASGSLYIYNQLIPLKANDARLLQLLCVKLHEIAECDYLIQGIWGKANSRKYEPLRTAISNLRKILSKDPLLSITSEYGSGYRLIASEEKNKPL